MGGLHNIEIPSANIGGDGYRARGPGNKGFLYRYVDIMFLYKMPVASLLIIFPRRRLDLDLYGLEDLPPLYTIVRTSIKLTKNCLLAVVGCSVPLCPRIFRCSVYGISCFGQHLQIMTLALLVLVALAGVANRSVTTAPVAVGAELLTEEFEERSEDGDTCEKDLWSRDKR